MKEIRLYIYANAPVMTEDRGSVKYLLQYVKDGREIGSRSESISFTERNQKGATLEAMISALTRINNSNTCPLMVICHSPNVIQGINMNLYNTWEKNDWKTSRGKDVEYKTEWQQISELIKTKLPLIKSRTPEEGEEEIMKKLGGDYFLAKTKLA